MINDATQFLDYAQIESRSAENGYPVSARTLRFYVDEGVLPQPSRAGKSPVYEADWILNALAALHLMKTRFNRSLRDIKTIFDSLREPPQRLADLLAVLAEDVKPGNSLSSAQRDWLIDTFFGALTGAFGRPIQPSEIRLTELQEGLKRGRWVMDGGRSVWRGIDPKSLFPQAAKAVAPIPAKVLVKVRARDDSPGHALAATAPEPSQATNEVTTTILEPTDTTPNAASVSPPPSVALVASEEMLEARAREEFFLMRFEAAVSEMGEVLNPLNGKILPVNPKSCSPLRHDHASSIIQKMKSRQVFDRELLDAIPLERALEFHIYRRGFLGRGELQVIVAGLTLSPIDAFLDKSNKLPALGTAEIEKAIAELVLQTDKFYYLGIYSTSGWSRAAIREIPNRKNLSCALIERDPKLGWIVHQSPNSQAQLKVFDPETVPEKIARTKEVLRNSPKLSLKGGHLVVQNLIDDLQLHETIIRTAVEEIVTEDEELTLEKAAGYEILKRRRF